MEARQGKNEEQRGPTLFFCGMGHFAGWAIFWCKLKSIISTPQVLPHLQHCEI